MQIDWLSVIIGFIIGFVSSLLANYLWDRYVRSKKPKGDYFTTTYSDKTWEFEGRMWEGTKPRIENVIDTIFRQIPETKNSTGDEIESAEEEEQ